MSQPPCRPTAPSTGRARTPTATTPARPCTFRAGAVPAPSRRKRLEPLEPAVAPKRLVHPRPSRSHRVRARFAVRTSALRCTSAAHRKGHHAHLASRGRARLGLCPSLRQRMQSPRAADALNHDLFAWSSCRTSAPPVAPRRRGRRRSPLGVDLTSRHSRTAAVHERARRKALDVQWALDDRWGVLRATKPTRVVAVGFRTRAPPPVTA